VEGRWTLIRDVALFQVKLLVDSFRDLLLVPVSLILGLLSLLNYRSEKGAEFYELLELGRRSERWINLFGTVAQDDAADEKANDPGLRDLDEIVAKVESFVVEEYRKGGVTAQAKHRLDAALATLGKLADRDRSKGKP